MSQKLYAELSVRRGHAALYCFCILLTSIGFASRALAQQPPAAEWSIPSNDELRAFLAQRMEHNGVGVVIGVIEPAGQRVVAYGRSGNPNAGQADEATRAH